MTLYLSRLVLNPLQRQVVRDVADAVSLHRRVMSGFPQGGDTPRKEFGVLHRLDVDRRRGRLELLVQSLVEPAWAALPDGYLIDDSDLGPNPATKTIEPEAVLTSGRVLRFRLRCNPARRIRDEAGKTRRVPLRGEHERRLWLNRKAEASGFSVASAEPTIVEEQRTTGRRRGCKNRVTVQPVLIEGRLVITQPALAQRALVDGVGPAKAYGMGLLSIAPE